MPEDEKAEQETEQTPKGLTVPVPRREDFFANLTKAARPEPERDGDSTPDGPKQ